MARKDSNWPTRGTPAVENVLINPLTENQSTEGEKLRRWPIVVIIATFRYLLEGVRILGQSYSVHDDRSSQ